MALRPTFAALIAAGGLLCLQACATPAPPVYGPIGDKAPYGYRDRPSGDGGQTVLAVVPGHSSLAQAQDFWDRRAKELCPAGVAKRIVFRAQRKEYLGAAPYVYGSAGISSRATTGFEVEGYVYCKAPGG